MQEADVGDDVFGEDPTINLLEEKGAQILGKEKSLFFPTGTMSNLVAIMTWCGTRGAEMILGDQSHIHVYEQGGMAQIGGVASRTLTNLPDGSMDVDLIEHAIRSNNIHYPTTELITIENTHNYCGGRILPNEFQESLRWISQKHHIPIHLDGARIWNAATALGVSVHKLTSSADSVSACLSKGLGAPAGTLLAGPADFIIKARRLRKAVGGGMRQVGILAAAGLQAIEDFEKGNILSHDHRRAKIIGQALSSTPGLIVAVDTIQTNIILIHLNFDHDHATTTITTITEQFLDLLRQRGVLALPRSPGLISDRLVKVLVTPSDPMVYGLDRDQIESSEAVTLLQLMQGIDMETFLPKDALVKENEF
eukprot:gene6948-7688_t